MDRYPLRGIVAYDVLSCVPRWQAWDRPRTRVNIYVYYILREMVSIAISETVEVILMKKFTLNLQILSDIKKC